MSRTGRLGIVFALFAVAVGLVVFAVMAFLRSSPPTVDFTSGHQAGQPVDMTVQTVPSIGFGIHPTWVSYLTKAPDGQWVHTTLWDLPAHTRVNVTIDQYDSGSPLRNQQFGLVQGTTDASLNAKPLSLIDSNGSANGVGHTFTIPALGVSVPLYGISGDAKNPCSVAPCATSYDHNVIQFSFTTPGPGQYPWQCFVPCGLGYLYGNGGPMQTLGYMGGFLKVTA
ncbi:MAG TPA: hypothetical protein VMV22_04845 [Acidimicrobiales bacterium]|nr:hypothetical protein [Acidimicrobiales bacterium]